MDPHGTESGAFGLERLGTHGGQKTNEEASVPAIFRPPWPEGEPEKGERSVLMLSPAPTILTIDDPRFIRVQPQTHLAHPLGDRSMHMLGLPPAHTMHDSIVGIAFEKTTRELPGHPHIKCEVHEQVRQDRRHRRPLRSSFIPLHKTAVWGLQRGSKPPLHIQQYPGGVTDSLHRLDNEVPRHACRTIPGLTTCFEDLADAIRAWAKGWLPTEAAAELLIGHRAWLLRQDFLDVAVKVGWEVFGERQVAVVDFAAAADAVQGVLPCSDGERQVLLIAASIAGGIPVDLREAVLCMDAVNAARAARAVCHAAGCRMPAGTQAGW